MKRRYLLYSNISLFLLFFIQSSAVFAQSRTLLQPVRYDQIGISGELGQRIQRNFDRLETDVYYPENVFPERHHSSSEGWPGDKEGRTILGLVLDAQATHRTSLYLDEMIKLIPQKMNKKGYLGPIEENLIDEQQLSGHGWLLRGLCEYYLWKKDPQVKTYIENIVTNLALPTKGFHFKYPIDPKDRVKNVGAMSGSAANVINGWRLSTDVGCDFIFMDGLVQAYSIVPSETLKELIQEMISRFLEMDIVKIKAQTHATLTGLRAIVRFYEMTGDRYLLDEVEKRYHLYRNLAITENYENFNWFERPEWTEPCAIVDSYLLATQLWQHTEKTSYLNDAQLIYYNALGHTQRVNGGFGCDNCPGPSTGFLQVQADEAFWCCTMRGAEGLSKAVQYSCFTQGDTIAFTSFNSGLFRFNKGDKICNLTMETNYPYNGKVTLRVDSLNEKSGTINLKFFIPEWSKKPNILCNGKQCKFQINNGFIATTLHIKSGDRIEYVFAMDTHIEKVANSTHTNNSYKRLFYGPLLLGHEGSQEITIPACFHVIRNNDRDFQIEGTTIHLSPVNHLMDSKVCQRSHYQKQVLFNIRASKI